MEENGVGIPGLAKLETISQNAVAASERGAILFVFFVFLI
jgi:hypothetical protein